MPAELGEAGGRAGPGEKDLGVLGGGDFMSLQQLWRLRRTRLGLCLGLEGPATSEAFCEQPSPGLSLQTGSQLPCLMLAWLLRIPSALEAFGRALFALSDN